MLIPGQLRIDNVIIYNGEFTRITTLTREKVGFFHRLHPDKEIFRDLKTFESEPGHLHPTDIYGYLLTKEVITDVLHFAEYRAASYPPGPIDEFTDGRIILRPHEEGISVFQPNNLPWAESLNIHMDFVCQIQQLHQLQNLYIDLFSTELDLPAIMGNPLK